MHELSLCRGILRTLERSAVDEGFVRVLRVRLRIGPMAAVDERALRFSFEVAGRGGLAEGASLAIEPGEGNEMRIIDLEVS